MNCVSSFQYVLPNAYYVLINVYISVCIAEFDTIKVTDSITTYSSIMAIKEKRIFILMTILTLPLKKINCRSSIFSFYFTCGNVPSRTNQVN